MLYTISSPPRSFQDGQLGFLTYTSTAVCAYLSLPVCIFCMFILSACRPMHEIPVSSNIIDGCVCYVLSSHLLFFSFGHQSQPFGTTVGMIREEVLHYYKFFSVCSVIRLDIFSRKRLDRSVPSSPTIWKAVGTSMSYRENVLLRKVHAFSSQYGRGLGSFKIL